MNNWEDQQKRDRYANRRFRDRTGALDQDYQYYPEDELSGEIQQEEWQRRGPFTGIGPRNYRRSDETIRDNMPSFDPAW